jgi:hypothetical protein
MPAVAHQLVADLVSYWLWVQPMVAVKFTRPGSNKSRKNNRTSVPYFLIGFGAPAGICRREFFMMAFSFWQLALSF